MKVGREDKFANLFIIATVVSLVGQLSWFAANCFSEIDYDGISYIGIARHLRNGRFYEAISAFRSPLISWIIAAFSVADRNFLQVGKLVHIGSFLASTALVYFLTKSLWHSRLVASVAALWFSLARGFASTAIDSVLPDFLLTVLVLTYFLILLRCFRFDHPQDWLLLGLVHGIAYLAKAFALPWLALASLVAVVLMFHGNRSRGAKRLFLAALLPLLITAAWAVTLHSKYGVFTTGSQFKANFLHYNLRTHREPEPPYAVLTNAVLGAGIADPSFEKSDEYLVNDPLPPQSPAWKYKLTLKQIAVLSIPAERRNLPITLKELTILLTPGGILGFIFALQMLMSRRTQFASEFNFALVGAICAVSLVLAYGMLVFLTTYAFPLVGLIIAVATRSLISDAKFTPNLLMRRICIGMVFAGLVVAFTYRSSPFRAQDRNFQLSCYDAARKLREFSAGPRIVSVGSGPYPDHGVGWEAGYRSAYFANRHIVAESPTLSVNETSLVSDIDKASADAVLVWGDPRDTNFKRVFTTVAPEYRTSVPILDGTRGQVGAMLIGRNSR